MINTATTRRAFVLVRMACLPLVLLLLLLPLSGTRGQASAALNETQKAERAIEFITLNGTVMAKIMGSDMPKVEKRLKLKVLLEEHLDLMTMRRVLVGPYWRKMTEQQQARYQKTSKQWVLLYSAYFMSTVKPTKFDVLSASPVGKDVLVKTETLSKESPTPFLMYWRVRFTPDDEATLIDMSFRGLSMVAAQRGEVLAILAEKGIPVFLDTLDERLIKIKQDFNGN